MSKSSLFNDWKDKPLFEVLKDRVFPKHDLPEPASIPPVEDDSSPICFNCLSIQEKETHFCQSCGAPAGTFTNVMPYEYILSLGDGFRKGVDPKEKLTPLKLTGLILASFAQYHIFAPFYWYRLYRVRNPKKTEQTKTSNSEYKYGESFSERISRYSVQQLRSSLEVIDRDKHPENYQLLLDELQKKENPNQ